MNPIFSVDGNPIPCPSAMTYKREDVSSSDAGRTEDGVMHKNMIGTVVGLELQWWNITTEAMHTLLNAFNPEYFSVKYLDPYDGNSADSYYKTDTFYCGNKSAPIYNASMGIWTNLSLNLIKRSC